MMNEQEGQQLSKEVYKSHFRQYGKMKKQRKQGQKKVESGENRVSRKKIQAREMFEKSRNAMFFQ